MWIDIRVKERIEDFKDQWDSRTETHYTTDFSYIEDNIYFLDLEVTESGITESHEEIESKLKGIIEGTLIDWSIE